MQPRPSRWTVLTLLFALLFQLGAAAAAGLPSQSCCGTCDTVAATADPVAAQHCDDATPTHRAHEQAPAHRHGSGACPLCGDHAVAFAPFVMCAIATLPVATPPTSVGATPLPALPQPVPHRLERPPRVA